MNTQSVKYSPEVSSDRLAGADSGMLESGRDWVHRVHRVRHLAFVGALCLSAACHPHEEAVAETPAHSVMQESPSSNSLGAAERIQNAQLAHPYRGSFNIDESKGLNPFIADILATPNINSDPRFVAATGLIATGDAGYVRAVSLINFNNEPMLLTADHVGGRLWSEEAPLQLYFRGIGVVDFEPTSISSLGRGKIDGFSDGGDRPALIGLPDTVADLLTLHGESHGGNTLQPLLLSPGYGHSYMGHHNLPLAYSGELVPVVHAKGELADPETMILISGELETTYVYAHDGELNSTNRQMAANSWLAAYRRGGSLELLNGLACTGAAGMPILDNEGRVVGVLGSLNPEGTLSTQDDTLAGANCAWIVNVDFVNQ